HAFVGGAGTLEPSGNLLSHPNGRIAFTARPNTNYVVDKWYVDGVVAQEGGNNFALNGIAEDHTVAAIFTPPNQLWPPNLVEAPTIVRQPQSQSVSAGSTVEFSVVASGTAPLSYQWYWNNARVTGATAAKLSISSAQAADAGVYF